MPKPAAEVESAVLAALEPLVGVLSSGPTRGGKTPQINLGRTSIQDWTTGAETGEQLLTVHVWSKEGDGRETARVTGIVRKRLGEGLDLGDGRVVKTRLEFEEARYDAQFSVHHGLLRFRAWIEGAE
jgi:Protein of unknown function (DUF3168)